MSAHSVLVAALVAALEEHHSLMLAISKVFDAPPVRAVRPYAEIEDAVLSDWSTKDFMGREGRVGVMLRDQGASPQRLRGLVGEVEAAVLSLPRVLGEGWRVASLSMVRSRVLREGEGRWTALCEFRVRMLQIQ